MGNSLYIGCLCSCSDALVAKTPDHKNVYLYFSNYLYKYPQHRFAGGIIDDIHPIWNNGFLMEILVQRKDLEDLRDFILHAEYDTEEFQNEGHVTFTYDPDALGYVIYLYSRQNLLRILSGKRYRCYKYCVGRKEKKRIVKQIERILQLQIEDNAKVQ